MLVFIFCRCRVQSWFRHGPGGHQSEDKRASNFLPDVAPKERLARPGAEIANHTTNLKTLTEK